MRAVSVGGPFLCRASQQEAVVIDGKSMAQKICMEITKEVASLKAAEGKVPGLAVILVGSRKDSQSYVRNKISACKQAGIESFNLELPETAKQEEVLGHIACFNVNPNVHGILVQLPLPEQISVREITEAVCPEKDVDGIHPLNIGRLVLKGSEPLFVPCTPRGIMELLERSGIEIKGKRAVVIGRSNIVGMPVALLLQNKGATVTVVHKQTVDAQEESRRADIVVVAVGKAGYIDRKWLKPGAVVVDVGINSVEDSSAKRGYRLVGDACFDDLKFVASTITPVPGGVGPMTIAMLLQNTVEAAKRAIEKDKQQR